MDVGEWMYQGKKYEITRHGCQPEEIPNQKLATSCDRTRTCEEVLKAVQKNNKGVQINTSICKGTPGGAKLLWTDRCGCKSDKCVPGIKNQGTGRYKISETFNAAVTVFVLGIYIYM